MLDTGAHATLEDLARGEVGSDLRQPVLRLTLLAPEIVEAILDGRQPPELHLDGLLKGFPLEWERAVGECQGPNLKAAGSNPATQPKYSAIPNTF